MAVSLDESIRLMIQDEVERQMDKYKQEKEDVIDQAALKPMTRKEFLTYVKKSWGYCTVKFWYDPEFIPLRYKVGGQWRIKVAAREWYDNWAEKNDES